MLISWYCPGVAGETEHLLSAPHVQWPAFTNHPAVRELRESTVQDWYTTNAENDQEQEVPLWRNEDC